MNRAKRTAKLHNIRVSAARTLPVLNPNRLGVGDLQLQHPKVSDLIRRVAGMSGQVLRKVARQHGV